MFGGKKEMNIKVGNQVGKLLIRVAKGPSFLGKGVVRKEVEGLAPPDKILGPS